MHVPPMHPLDPLLDLLLAKKSLIMPLATETTFTVYLKSIRTGFSGGRLFHRARPQLKNFPVCGLHSQITGREYTIIYLKDTTDFLLKLKSVDKLPPGSLLITLTFALFTPIFHTQKG